jgi:RHS repeat-associated protein
MIAARWSRSLLLVVGGLVAAASLAVGGTGGREVVVSGDIATVERAAGAQSVAVPARVARMVPGARLVQGRSSAFSDTYVGTDGTAVTRVSASPLNFRDGAGRWRAIDSTLVARGDGFVNRAGAHVVRLPRQLSSGVSASFGGAHLSMRLAGADAVASVRGARATYRDALSGVDAVYDSQPQGLREQLVIADRRAPKRFAFELTASAGLRARIDRTGAIAFVRGRRTVFALPPAVTFPQGDEGELHPARNVLRRSGSGWTLTVIPDRDWVVRELGNGPVVLDPTVEIDPDSQDCSMESDTPTTSYCSSTHLLVGYHGGTGAHDHRALVQFDLSVLPKDAVILNADFGLTLGFHSTSNLKQVGVYQVKRAWTNSMTWNRYDATNSWTGAGASDVNDAATTPAAVQTVGDTSGFVDWYPTRLVQGWVDGSIDNRGVLVRDVTPNTTSNELDFSSREGGSVTPELDIVWAPRTGQLGSYTFDSQRLTDRSSIGVNVANGNLLLTSNDVNVRGTGLDLQVARYHNSMATGWGDEAIGIPGTMSLGRDVKLTEFADGSVAFFRGDGVVLPFLDRTIAGGTASFASPSDLNATLTQDTSTGVYTMTFNRTEVRFFFNDDGQLTSIKDRNDNTISLSYFTGGFHGLSQITDTQGRVYGVDETPFDDFLSAITDPTGRTWAYTYGDFNDDYLTDYEDPAGNHTLYGYDSSHRLNQVTTPEGNVTKITYDGTSERVASVMRTTNPSHTTGPTTTYAYSSGSPCTTGQTKTVVSDPNSHNITYCSNTKDQVVTATDAAGNKRATTYTLNGDVNDATDTPGGTGIAGLTSLIYDTDNNLTSVTGAEGEVSQIQYYTASDTGGGGGPLAKFRPKQATDDQGTSEFYKYDTHGNMTQVADAASSPRNKADLAYNTNGTLQSATDGNGHTTTFGYTSGNLTSITPPTPLLGTTLTVDGLSRVKTVKIGPSGVTKTLTYDDLDRVTRVDLSDGSYFTYSYDDDGHLTARADSAGNSTSYTVDPLGRRTDEDFPGGRSNDYTYDNAGNVKTITDAAGTVTYNYDTINRVSSIVSPTASGSSTDTVSYTYDDPNRKQTMTLPGSTTEAYEQDKSGNVKQITVKNSGGTVLRSFAYDYTYGASPTKHGSLLRKVTDQSGQKTTYTYTDSSVPEDVGRLVKARVETSGGSLVEEWRYKYDAAGNRTKLEDQTTSTTTTTYAYDNANELCWKYTGTSSNLCGSPPSGATTYTFDGHGNETAAGSTSYSYDALDRATGLAGTTAGYLTPDNGELVSFGTTSFQSNLLGLSRQIGASTTTNYVRDPAGTPVSQRTSSSKQFFINDRLGSTVALTDTTGSIVRSYSYDADGNATSSGSGATTDLKFASGHQVGSLYHFGARYYDPNIGRWTQQDPINQLDDLTQANRYAYAAGDPVNNTDPLGTLSFKKILRKVAGAAGIVGGVSIAGACLAATRGFAATHCLSVGGSLTVGGAVLLTTD